MRHAISRVLAVATTLALAPTALAGAELQLPEPSPLARVMQTVGVSRVTVEYSSPAMRDPDAPDETRTIFGGLVPYGELWRTGANAATEITFSHEAEVAGEPVPAGSYAVFTIPGEDTWTVILNEDTDQGGTDAYDEELDAVRVEVEPKEAPLRKRMTFLFSDTTSSRTHLELWWERTRVSVPIAFDTPELAQANIDAFVDSAGWELADAARYAWKKQDDVEAALDYIEGSIAVDRTWFNTFLKAEFLAEQGDYGEAHRLGEKAWKMGQESDHFFWRDRVKESMKEWKEKR